MNLTKEIKKLAINEGFHKVGVSSIDRLNHSSYLSKWIDSNYHGDMAWIEKNKDIRLDIKKYFPNAQSIICVAHNYYTDQRYGNNQDIAKISRYA